MFGEVNVFLPTDWERGAHLLNRLTFAETAWEHMIMRAHSLTDIIELVNYTRIMFIRGHNYMLVVQIKETLTSLLAYSFLYIMQQSRR